MVQQIGRYQIRGRLGQGGMATVYVAYDPNFDREVALKVLPPQLLHVPTFRKRFEREAKTIARLERWAVVPVHDFGEESGMPYLVMGLMRGGSLAERLGQEPLMLGEVARFFQALAPTLDEAHECGIIHRDLKPANLLFDEHDRPVIADFGIAKWLQGTPSISTGGVIGTPEYMSPEQWEGLTLDGRSDIYALGVIFYQMLVGDCPYTGTTAGAIMKQHLMNPLPNICAVRPELPVGCQTIVERTMAKDREQRYPTAIAFSQAIQQLITLVESPNPSAPLPSLPSQATSAPLSRPTSPISAKYSISGPPLNKRLWTALGTLGVFFLSFLTIIIMALNFSSPAAETPAGQGMATLGIGSTRVAADGMRQVYVPEGTFIMGSQGHDPEADDDESPQHTVYLDAFWIDQTEVTNAQYAACVAAKACQSPANKSSYTRVSYYDNPDYRHYPVILVSWEDARSYCEWAGRRLPTEAEWEKAARGTDGQTYPWGDEPPTAEWANFGGHIGDTTKVKSYPNGISPYGAYDMAGNVWEWVADGYEADYYATSPRTNPPGASIESVRVLRGGSWSGKARIVRSANRGKFSPLVRYLDDGFRCSAS